MCLKSWGIFKEEDEDEDEKDENQDIMSSFIIDNQELVFNTTLLILLKQLLLQNPWVNPGSTLGPGLGSGFGRPWVVGWGRSLTLTLTLG